MSEAPLPIKEILITDVHLVPFFVLSLTLETNSVQVVLA